MNNAASVGDVVLFSQPGQKGSFQRLSQLLDSPVPAGEPTKSVTGAMTTQWRVEDVWPYLVEAQYRARLDPSGIHLPLRIMLPPQEAFSPGGATYPNGAYGAESILPLAARPKIDDTTLASYLDRYPNFRTRQGVGPMWGESQFRVIWENDSDHKQTIRHEAFTLYRGGRYAFPAMGNDSRALHPLMAWWAVLFALSMLARYQPDQWTKMINVDQHPQATSLEYVLDLAIRAVPDLVDETIVAVST